MAENQKNVTATRKRAGRLAVGAAVVATFVAGGAAVGLAGDADNGRDIGERPGQPVDVAPVADPQDGGGRGNDAAPGPAVVGDESSTGSFVATGVDNGRGGTDPAVGPAGLQAESEPTREVAPKFDTDDGQPPAPPEASSGGFVETAPEAPTDQDVPGAQSPQPAAVTDVDVDDSDAATLAGG